MKKILIAILTVLMATSLCGCALDSRNDHEILATDYFEYYIEDNEVEICGLTELGYEQSVLVIPETIGGYPVVRFGGRRALGWDQINSENLVKLIFLSNKTFHEHYFGHPVEKVIYVDFDTYGFNHAKHNLEEFFAPSQICDEISEKMVNVPIDYRVSETNVAYFYNYEGAPNNNFFMADHLEVGESFFCPYVPEREGYTFEGWSLRVDSDDRIDLSSMQMEDSEITFYAKWHRN